MITRASDTIWAMAARGRVPGARGPDPSVLTHTEEMAKRRRDWELRQKDENGEWVSSLPEPDYEQGEPS